MNTRKNRLNTTVFQMIVNHYAIKVAYANNDNDKACLFAECR
ncbi:hypothetical protein ykris0001_3510 [Yersinia kristensenii ATCC 33638]|nr:hypothetical protein ykris0001_3510 [Yersinia kristensenii ATCC 33638]